MNLIDALPRGSNPILKLTLPWSEALSLLNLLRRLEYSTHRLFPDFKGVVDAIYEYKGLGDKLDSRRT